MLSTDKEGDGVVAGQHRVTVTETGSRASPRIARSRNTRSRTTSGLTADVDAEHTEFTLRSQVDVDGRRPIAELSRLIERDSHQTLQETIDHDLGSCPDRFASPCIAGTIASAPALVRADDFRLESATLPAPLVDASGKVNVVIEASGVEPIGDGHRILVAHDKHPALFVVDVATGRIVGEPITSPKFPEPSKLGGPKWEGMARDAEGNYYIIGAHVGKTDEERASKSVLLRFRLKDSDQPAIDDASVVRWDIARSLESALKAEGLDAEAVGQAEDRGPGDPREQEGRRLGLPRAGRSACARRPTRSAPSSPTSPHRRRPTPSSSSSRCSPSRPSRAKG